MDAVIDPWALENGEYLSSLNAKNIVIF